MVALVPPLGGQGAQFTGLMSQIRDNLERVRERIAEAARRSGRDPADVTLVAVTKTVPVKRMREAVEAGAIDLGESYYQELREKLPLFGPDERWHFIGHLQSNKARYIAGKVALVHSVDSVALAREIGKRAVEYGAHQDILLEVKLDPAPTKTGIAPEAVLSIAEQVSAIPGLRLRGLMGMAPFAGDPEHARPYFARLQRLFDELPVEWRNELSMGMTGDFEVAIEEGATVVRIGTAIFGSRG